MQLAFEKIKSVTCGAVDVVRTPEGICFHRFTQAQRDLYEEKKNNFFSKTLGTAGVRLSFKTDSRNLSFKFLLKRTCLRLFYSVDVCVNGEFIGCVDNHSDMDVPAVYSSFEFPVYDAQGCFELGEGEKTVVIHLPWNMNAALQELCLDDGAFVEPVKPNKVLLAYGDSITHGFDALHTSKRYIARLADALDAQEFNKAIGGERYFAELAAIRDDLAPDYIVVAYGTNDWRYSSREQFIRESAGTLQNLCRNYPNAKIFVISPIWRKIYETKTAFSSFFEIDRLLRNAAEELDNVTVIKGFDFVPKESRYFADGTLHPTDEGFGHYFNSLWKEIKDIV